MEKVKLKEETLRRTFEIMRIGNSAVRRAQAENREKGIPNVYSKNGKLYFELPNGEMTSKNPFE